MNERLMYSRNIAIAESRKMIRDFTRINRNCHSGINYSAPQNCLNRFIELYFHSDLSTDEMRKILGDLSKASK